MTEEQRAYEAILSDLRQTRAFADLSQEKLEHLVSLCTLRTFDRGEILLQEQEENDRLFMLLRGSVSVYSGGKFVCSYARAGDTFGEMSIISGAETTATVVANESLEVLTVGGETLAEFRTGDDHELVSFFYRLVALALVDKLRLTTLKARLFEDAVRHAPLPPNGSGDYEASPTAEKALHATLVTSQAVHTADQAILLSDAEGRLARVNLAAERLFGISETQVVGEPLARYCTETDYNAIFHRFLAEEMSSWRGEMEFVKATGEVLPTRTSISAILDGEGATIGYLAILTDLTREKGLEQQLHAAQRMEVIGRLAGGMAHEFNNVLQVIGGTAESALAHGLDRGEQEQALHNIQHAVERGMGVTQRLLAFSGRSMMQAGLVRIEELIDNVTSLIKPMLGDSVHVDVDVEDEGAVIHADTGLLELVLVNLCMNARDAMPDGGTLRIATRTAELTPFAVGNWGPHEPGRYVEILLHDTGLGIPSRYLDRVFDPFFTTKEGGRATGLGLSMAKGSVEQHGGFMRLESQPGVGTTVWIYLPLAPPSQARLDNVPARGPDAERGSETVLVADDEPDMRRLVTGVLENAGYRVMAASNGNEVCAALEGGPGAHLVLLDSTLPGAGPAEVMAVLQRTRQATQVVMMTGGGRRESERAPPGIAARLAKPFSAEQLLQTVRATLDAAHHTGNGA